MKKRDVRETSRQGRMEAQGIEPWSE